MYDTLIWAEATQNNGLAGVAAKGPAGYVFTGDTITLKDMANPMIHQMGGCSDTKAAGMGIRPTNSNYNVAIHGPAHIQPIPNGILDVRESPIKLQRGDVLTSLLNDTNVNEGALVFADVSYGQTFTNWSISKYRNIFHQDCIVTSGADVTNNSGAVPIKDACVSTVNWFDPEGEYYILGIHGNIGVAASSGVLQISNVGKQWQGYTPGIVNNMLSGVTFGVAQGLTLALEPIGPITGDAMANSCTIGATHTTAGALVFTLVIAKTR